MAYTAKARLYLTADKDRVVPGDDPAAAYLLAGEGTEVPADEVERLGLTADQVDGLEAKAAKPAEDKAVRGAANKGKG